MTKTNKLKSVSMAIILLLSLTLNTLAYAQPAVPMTVYGVVLIDTVPAGAGLTVYAKEGATIIDQGLTSGTGTYALALSGPAQGASIDLWVELENVATITMDYMGVLEQDLVYTGTPADPDTGTLIITTTPVTGAVFVDGDPWTPASQEVEVGTYAVTFGVVALYDTPASQEAVVTDGGTRVILGTYVLTPVDPDDDDNPIVVEGDGFTITYFESDTVVYDDTLIVQGIGVTGGADVEVYWDSVSGWDGESGLLNVTDGNPSGTWDLTIDVPSGLVGAHYVWAKDVSSGDTAMIGPITMVPRIKMSPSSGLEDDEVTISGYGFGDEVDVDTISVSVTPSTPETDELGYWTAKFDALGATFTVVATDEDGNSASKSWTVGPAIELDVDEGSVGTVVEVSARGFTPDSVITVPYPVDQEDEVTVKNDGTFTVDIVIPQVSNGDYNIVVTETPGTSTANEDFDVEGQAEIEVTPGHGPQGSSVTVEGWNFTQFEASVFVTLNGLGETEFETDSDGHFEGIFVIPAIASMEYVDGLIATQDNDDDVDYGIDASTDFRTGIMIVILNPESGPAGTLVTVTGTGFTDSGDWNATFGDDDWQDDESNIDTEISARLYAPSVDAGVYTVSIMDIDAEIIVDVEFTITDETTLESDPTVAPAGYDIELTGTFFSEDLPVVIDDFVLYNSTDDWDDNDMVDYTVVVEEDDDDWDDGYFEVTFTLPDEDTLGIGSYTLNVTDSEGMFAQLVFEIVDETIDIDSRKMEFSVGDTLAFDVESSFPMDESYIEISDPSGDLYWSTDPFTTSEPDMWITVGNIQRVLYADQVAGGNPMEFLEDAPLGTWTWEYIDNSEDDEVIDSGAFSVSAAAGDMVAGQVEDLATDIDALVDEIAALADDIVDYSSEFDSVKDDIAAVASLAADAVAAAEAAANAVTSVASVAGDAATAAEAAAEAATAAKDAASGLTTLVYGAIGASLVAALAAIVSLMQISRRIAG